MRFAFLMFAVALPLLSQEDRVIRTTVDLVQVDATVTDAQGRHVADLKASDFQIYEDGKAQKITHFSYVQGPAPRAAAQPVPRKGGKVTATDIAPARELRRDQVQRTFVLLADDLGLSPDDISNVRRAMKKFVDEQMLPGDLVSIMTTSGGMGAMEQLTSDKRQLYSSINRIHYVRGRVGLTWYEPTNIGDAARRAQNEINARIGAPRGRVKAIDTLGALAYAIRGLREMPGRKAIALFSGGFRESPLRIVEMANRASVVLYTFDPRGVVSFFLTAVDVCAACTGGGNAERIRTSETGRETAYRVSQRSLNQLAAGTGGTFFHDDNDLSRGLGQALNDMGSYYVIGYQPQREDFERLHGAVKFHRIQVKVQRPGLHVRSRSGFSGVPDAPVDASDHAPGSAKDELRKALLSPFHASGFPVQLSAFYSASTSKDAKTGRYPTTLRAMLAFDARKLEFAEGPDAGKKRLNLEVVAALYGADDEVAMSGDGTFAAELGPDELERTLASGLVYGLDLEIPKPGPYQLRIAALDANGGRTGSASLFIDVPDFNGHGLAISSILLSDSDAERGEKLTRAGVIGAGNPVTRAFAPGAVLKYDCTVFGATTEPNAGKANVAVEVRLFRGPEKIYTGQALPLAISDGNSPVAIHAAGEIKLPATLPPGDYAVELTVYDRAGKQPERGAVQWSDFTLVGVD